ncbi:MAG TPA: hypothetical protein HPP77_02560 [Candidatus Hydrogenedentes bacterium]|nr:hypothetical protein [Candidatus Hydrogenedentota bacterium]
MLLPIAERRGEIHFYVAKSLPYNARLIIAFLLMIAGLVVEAILLDSAFWVGLPIVLAGVIMLLTKGYDNTVQRRRASKDWRPATRAEVERIIALDKKQRDWDKATVDITCTRGLLTLVAIAVVAGLTALFLSQTVSQRMLPVVIGNAAVMVLPFWVTGVRSILKNDKLIIKAKMLLEIEKAFERFGRQSDEEFQYQLQTAKAKDGSGEVPGDAKAVLAFHEGPPEFLGMQIQVSINSVQGNDFPYFYCVLVARPGLDGMNGNPFSPPPRNVIIEPKRQDDVDIVVIRQRTTKNSGYHTKQPVATRIFFYALEQTRNLVTGH